MCFSNSSLAMDFIYFFIFFFPLESDWLYHGAARFQEGTWMKKMIKWKRVVWGENYLSTF